MFKKKNNLRNQTLELIIEGQIDREIFPKKHYGTLHWSTGEFSVDEYRMQYLIPVMNITTKKIYKNTEVVENQEGLFSFTIHELCINGKQLYDGSRYAYLDYKGQPIIHAGHYKNHFYPHKPSIFNIIGYTNYLMSVSVLEKNRVRRVGVSSKGLKFSLFNGIKLMVYMGLLIMLIILISTIYAVTKIIGVVLFLWLFFFYLLKLLFYVLNLEYER